MIIPSFFDGVLTFLVPLLSFGTLMEYSHFSCRFFRLVLLCKVNKTLVAGVPNPFVQWLLDSVFNNYIAKVRKVSCLFFFNRL
jgi:hypothetical protein